VKGRLGGSGKLGGLVAVVILAFLPIPYDKMIEVRPDLVATFFTLLGITFLIRGMRDIGDIRSKSKRWFWASGIAYGIGLGVVPKTIFFIPPVILTFGFLWIYAKERSRIIGKNFGLWMVGLSLPLFIILLVAISSGDFARAFLLMTKVPSQASKALSEIYNHSFYMFPSHFFHPNQTFYGVGGIQNLQYVMNLLIWIIASVWGVIRLVGFLREDQMQTQARELLIGASFLSYYAGFTDIFPLKHAQYMIPLTPFIAMYFADFLASLARLFQKRSSWIPIVGIIVFYIFIIKATINMNSPKLSWTNNETFTKIANISQIVPAGSYVFDLSAESMIYRDPYYICCVPYGQYMEALTGLNVPDLPDTLKKTNTEYVISSRLGTLPPSDLKYIEENYTYKLLGGLILSNKSN
ncbi:glycosyltransferase family 39 protein, partial [Candidatus Gottesmanbacteria bacterium]|nr:glycosyltransferase family 39 protein [Candidatus Gottesmanbacteria bacterium]